MRILDVIDENVAFATLEILVAYGTGHTSSILMASGVALSLVATTVHLVTCDALPAFCDTSKGPVLSGTRLGHQVNQTDQLNAEPTVT